ncbi:hypothetical protein M427DRAFT_59766 [Gonapodya prolifera JEL478]|uniref:Uncharacterized protein n=1 Tax=Gonapodya prolifera (strain JEL478) TaxID=1344416 RepID=A0A139A5I2_GONPJ|nr:hypothetical protein M427DRAFT_59766 [Gonapodya prolifera JEL478]|eukprot:KXS12082.1 hypothetical protein M427DRAFT_59766 [Gonapodya prolifera JEL478]
MIVPQGHDRVRDRALWWEGRGGSRPSAEKFHGELEKVAQGGDFVSIMGNGQSGVPKLPSARSPC